MFHAGGRMEGDRVAFGGFQQGFDSSQRGDEVVDLIRWRCLVRSDYSPSPHKNDHYTCTAVESFDMECHPQQVGLGKDRD